MTRDVAHAREIIAYLNAHDVETFVYRSRDDERAKLRTQFNAMLRDASRAQMRATNDDDNANVARMRDDIRAFAKLHKFTL